MKKDLLKLAYEKGFDYKRIPTLRELQDWLYSEYNIWITIGPDQNELLIASIYIFRPEIPEWELKYTTESYLKKLNIAPYVVLENAIEWSLNHLI